MNNEMLQILKMVENGTISSEEASKLIESIKTKTNPIESVVTSTKKFIKIEVYSKDDDDKEETKVKINVPLNLARTMLQMNSIKNQISVNANNINIDFDEIIRLIEHDANGELLNIESGETRVRIWIE